MSMSRKKNSPQESFPEKKVSGKGLLNNLILALCALAGFTAMTATPAGAQFKIIYAFDSYQGTSAAGFTPIGGVIFDGAGNLYGTNASSGTHGGGAVFELTPSGAGGWTLKVLFNFNLGDAPDGSLVMDGAGNLYGTTIRGGSSGCGTVFELTPGSGGGWTEKLLRTFNCYPDGQFPEGGVVLDAAGNVYGTTNFGGTSNYGIVYELKKGTSGNWAEKILHSFGVSGSDGVRPLGSLIFDAAGNLYGTTDEGGYGNGTVYEVEKSGAEKVLYIFEDGLDGAYPLSGVTFDSAGNLYGTTNAGGSIMNGAVFEMTRSGNEWSETPLYTFSNGANEGLEPNGPVVLDSAGNVYAETVGGSGRTRCGSVFELTPSAGGGNWTEIQIVSFFNSILGESPEGGLVFDSSGNLYGTAEYGGPGSGGIVFEVTP
jgi:uncharacterized repeat protein (TIGR03803 family)